MRISLSNVASYGKEPAILETNKRINLVYGLNGSGKTTLSRFLYNQAEERFCSCSLNGLQGEKIFVYNRDFVDREVSGGMIEGTFTLSSKNDEIKKEIEKILEEGRGMSVKLRNDKNKTGIEYELEKKEQEWEEEKKRFEGNIWEDIKQKYDRGILSFCLEGFDKGDRKRFFEKFLQQNISQSEPDFDVKDLEDEANRTQGEEAREYDEGEILRKKISFDFSLIEKNDIFAESVVGLSNSEFSKFIQSLGNFEWVRSGQKYLLEKKKFGEDKNGKCPFCQKGTIDSEFLLELKRCFSNDEYKMKIEHLKSLEKMYWDNFYAIPKEEAYLEYDFIKEKEREFKLLYREVEGKLRSNWSAIKEKLEKPSEVKTIQDSSEAIKNLNDFLDQIIVQILEHNGKVKNKTETKRLITRRFWEIMAWNKKESVQLYKDRESVFKKDISKLKEEKEEMEDKIRQKDVRIHELRKGMIGIQGSVQTINDSLKDLGIESFHLVPVDEKYFKIKRDGEKENDTHFPTLSEGEKTIISFLYFLEKCREQGREGVETARKIVVIDDPISSLSHTYVFNVAQLIKHSFFKKKEYSQIFILTHNLYFFHEFLKCSDREEKEDMEMFRIRKNGKFSEICKMDSGEIQNDYQCYWKMIREDVSPAFLANSMRNILEYFFDFIGNEEYRSVIGRVDPKKFEPFIRYINRESHSDAINVSDFKEIDPNLFKEAFEEVFRLSKHEEHYRKMMGEK